MPQSMTTREFPPPVTLVGMFEQGLDRKLNPFYPPMFGKPVLNLGAGNKKILGSRPLDAPVWWAAGGLPEYEDDSIGAIYAYHLLEHLTQEDLIHLLRECERVLCPADAPLNIVVPHWSSDLAYEDVDHKRYFAEDTLPKLFENDYYDGSVNHSWRLRVNISVLMGVNKRNLCLLQQVIKLP